MDKQIRYAREKGQISAEMIIVLAILLGLVFIVSTRLQETAKTASDNVRQQSLDIFERINTASELGTKLSGDFCSTDSECSGGTCSVGICK